jgi:hypothetical protein
MQCTWVCDAEIISWLVFNVVVEYCIKPPQRKDRYQCTVLFIEPNPENEEARPSSYQ